MHNSNKQAGISRDLTRRDALGLGASAVFISGCNKASDSGEPLYHGNNFSNGASVLETPLRGEHPSTDRPFRLNFAPHFGMFEDSAGPDFISQLEFAAAEGFRAWEDNAMPIRSEQEQLVLYEAMKRLDIQMGVFVAGDRKGWAESTLTSGAPDHADAFLSQIKAGIETANRVGAKWLTVLPGQSDPGVRWAYQMANVIDNLKRAAELLEPHDLVLALEPVNTNEDFPEVFMDRTYEAYLACKAVDSPACKLLFDIYHHQVMDGNIIRDLDACWEEICYLQIADHPGRNEPLTGEINYANILQHVYDKGYTGIIGMEHGVNTEGAEGERMLIERYREMNTMLG